MTMNNRIKILILGFVAVLCTVLGIVSFNSKEDEGTIVESLSVSGEKSPDMSPEEASEGANASAKASSEEVSEGANASAKVLPEEVSEGVASASSKTPAEIVVFVCGEVNFPGVYSFGEGERIQAAVVRAGGLTEDADENYVNQADYLTDGAKLYFPSREEAKEMPQEDVKVNASAGQTDESTGLVNINTATCEELMTLPGVGQSKADSIINFRNEHGAFKSIEDIMNITGIKEGLFGKIKDKITV